MTYLQVCHQSGRVLFTTDNEVTARNREQFGWKVIEVNKSREQFEQWFPDMVEGMPPSMVEVFDKMLFIAWQASRAAIEIELPDSTEFDGPDMSGAQQAISQIREMLTETGIKVKE